VKILLQHVTVIAVVLILARMVRHVVLSVNLSLNRAVMLERASSFHHALVGAYLTRCVEIFSPPVISAGLASACISSHTIVGLLALQKMRQFSTCYWLKRDVWLSPLFQQKCPPQHQQKPRELLFPFAMLTVSKTRPFWKYSTQPERRLKQVMRRQKHKLLAS
jgi:hypothetical protein